MQCRQMPTHGLFIQTRVLYWNYCFLLRPPDPRLLLLLLFWAKYQDLKIKKIKRAFTHGYYHLHDRYLHFLWTLRLRHLYHSICFPFISTLIYPLVSLSSLP